MKAALSCSSSKYRSLIKRKSVATSIVKALRSLVVYEKYTRREPRRAFSRYSSVWRVLINGMCIFEVRAARRREYERRAFVAHKLLLLQPQQVAVVRLGSLCSSSHTAKNFAFIFDMQALVRLFLPCGSPCVRSTSDCAVLLRSWRTKDGGITRELSLSMRVPLVASNELAIVTKSIAFVSPPRTTDNLVENCPYLSGGREARKGKRGYIYFRELNVQL